MAFFTKLGDPCPANEKPTRFGFRCVNWNKGRDPRLEETRCELLLLAEGPFTATHGIKHDPQGQNEGRPQWNWNGNREAPTLTPSINCDKHCGWHGYIENGRCVSTSKEDEPS